jgi:hypothetical protein
MSLETLNAAIAAKRIEFDALNKDRFLLTVNYFAMPEADEEKIGQLADEISRLYLTRSVLWTKERVTNCTS